MAASVISSTLERLGDLLIQECNFLYGVSKQVEEMKVELNRMRCFLIDADKRQDEDERVRNWVGEIRDLAYETENVVENYVVENFVLESASEWDRGFCENIIGRLTSIIRKGIALHKVGSEIGKIKNNITSLTRSLQTYGIKGEGSDSAYDKQRLLRTSSSHLIEEGSHSAYDKQRLLRKSYPHLIEEDFVGMERDEEQLVSHLMAMDKHSGVITIKGMGGQGKTAIATRIYNHNDVRRNFNSFAWFCVTQQCQTKSIWQDILRQLLPERKADIMQMGDTDLVQELYKVQQEKKCLVVLDDIWSTTDWDSLKPAFPIVRSTVGSKILITTRKLDTKVGLVHVLEGLDEDASWMLLQKKAFPREVDNQDFKANPEMVKLGRDMVKKCGGLPLAISVVGGVLKDKTTLREWKMVRENIISYLRRGEGIEEDYRAVTQVLALSYNDLPYCLKSCFLYLGLFPEDFPIEVERLCLLWIAEGFVSSDHKREGETMMDVAEGYLDELARRSMVQVNLIRDFSSGMTTRFESCRLHDLMRDMCVLTGVKEDFLKTMDYRSHPNRELVLSKTTSSRRLAVYSNNKGICVKIPSTQHKLIRHVRSLLMMSPSLLMMNPYSFSSSFASKIPDIIEFKFLRVLDVQGLRFKELKVIPKLIHSRHLSFRDCDIEKFPLSTITNLRYLQTLDLRLRYNAAVKLIIPHSLFKMKQLQHLFLPHYHYSSEDDHKLRLNGLPQLEVLHGFRHTVFDVEDIVKLNKLWFLEARVEENLEDLASFIECINAASSCHLRKTSIEISRCTFCSEDVLSLLRDLFGCLTLHTLDIDGPIEKLPKYDQFSSSLTSISLWCSELKEDPMEAFKKLPNLQRLSLYCNAFVGKEMVCSTMGFPQLRTLGLWGLSNIEKWHVESGSMPNLQTLKILKCEKLEMLPEGLKFLHALKELEIEDMPEAFKNRVREVDGVEGEDFHKVRHVPSIKL